MGEGNAKEASKWRDGYVSKWAKSVGSYSESSEMDVVIDAEGGGTTENEGNSGGSDEKNGEHEGQVDTSVEENESKEGLDWAAGGRAFVRAFIPFGSDIYPEANEPGFDASKVPIYATVPDVPIGPGAAKITLKTVRILIKQKGVWKHAINGRIASKETLKAAGLTKPGLTTTTDVSRATRTFEKNNLWCSK